MVLQLSKYQRAPHCANLMTLSLAPCGITRFFTDHWGAYARHLAPETHVPGKRTTQQIERKHLTWRTLIKRLASKTICFSKSIEWHDIVIGLFVNRYELGLRV